MSERTRTTVDVSHLPHVVFGHRSNSWWATLGFMTIEGMTLAVGVASYFYLRKNFPEWPPPRTPEPDLLVPAINAIVFLVSLWPALWIDRAAKAKDIGGLRRAFIVASMFNLVMLALRTLEFYALNIRWDDNAYGSVTWLILGFHASLLLVNFLECVVFTILFFVGPVEEKHFVDASDVAFYWYYLVASWIALFAVVFLGPSLF